MSELLNNVGKIMKKGGKEAVRKTKDMKEAIKIKTQIVEEEKNIRKCYEEIGKTYYELYGSKPDDQLQKLCSSIFLSNGNIKHLKKEMDSIRIKNNV